MSIGRFAYKNEGNFQTLPREDSSIGETMSYAEELHRGQKRKGTELSYFEGHLMPVAHTVFSHKGTSAQIKAALLHDSMEDCGSTRASLSKVFSTEVIDIIEDCTKRGTQEATFERIRYARPDSRLVIMADKFCNLSDTEKDYAALGSEVWKRFKGGEKVMQKFKTYGDIFLEWGTLSEQETRLRQSYLHTLNRFLTTLGQRG